MELGINTDTLNNEQTGGFDGTASAPILTSPVSHDVLMQAVEAAQQAKLKEIKSSGAVVPVSDPRTNVKQTPISVRLNLKLNDKAISRISDYVAEKARNVGYEQSQGVLQRRNSRRSPRTTSLIVHSSKTQKGGPSSGGNTGSGTGGKKIRGKSKSKKRSSKSTGKRRGKSVSFCEPYKSEKSEKLFYGHNARVMPESLMQHNRDQVLKAAESLLDASYIRKQKKSTGKKYTAKSTISSKAKKLNTGKTKSSRGGSKGYPLADRSSTNITMGTCKSETNIKRESIVKRETNVKRENNVKRDWLP